MYLPVLNPIDDRCFLKPAQALRLVQAGRAAIVEVEGRECLRYLDVYEAMRIRRDIALERARILDDMMIAEGRRVVYWNGSGDYLERHAPGEVRS